MKITKEMLSRISDLAKNNYKMDNNPTLDSYQLIAQAWLKAVNVVVNPELNLEFPERVAVESVFED